MPREPLMATSSTHAAGFTAQGLATWGTSGGAPPEPGTTRRGGRITIESRSRAGPRAGSKARSSGSARLAAERAGPPNAVEPIRVLPPRCMHGANLADDREDAEADRGGADGRDGAAAFEPVQGGQFEGQGTTATLAEARAVPRHDAVLPVGEPAP